MNELPNIPGKDVRKNGRRRAASLGKDKEQQLEDRLIELEDLDLEALRTIWAAEFGPIPKLRSVEFLRLMIAWRWQKAAYGGIDKVSRRQLAASGRVGVDGLQLGQGARLRRMWMGQMVEVVVTSEGFLHDGTIYKSLSKIAEKVTGCVWSGPRFFGLRKSGDGMNTQGPNFDPLHGPSERPEAPDRRRREVKR